MGLLLGDGREGMEFDKGGCVGLNAWVCQLVFDEKNEKYEPLGISTSLGSLLKPSPTTLHMHLRWSKVT